jgi:hypothetical protein
MTPEATELWKVTARTTPGGQARYSDLAIQTCLMLRTAFRIPLRQAEGLMASVFTLMKVSLNVPDHTTVSRWAAAMSPLPRIPAQRQSLKTPQARHVSGTGTWPQYKKRDGWPGRGVRALAETMMAYDKTLIGPRLRARGFAAQKTEVTIGVVVLNRLLSVARPHSVRKQVRSV